MTIPSSMGSHLLGILKGKRDDLVDYTGILAATANANGAVVAGRVMTLNSSQLLIPGLALGKLPFYAWSGLDANNAPDVLRTRGMPYSGAVPFGTYSYKCAAELTTTEIDPAQASAYLPGVALTALSTAATTLANAGWLVPVAASTDVVVGYVSPAGLFTSADGYATLGFYPDYVKGTTVLAA